MMRLRTHMTLSGQLGTGRGLLQGTCFGNAEAVLSEDVRSDVVFGADDEGGKDARIGVDGLNCRTVGHGSRFTPLRGLDFGFWILDFGLRTLNPKSKIANPKSACPKPKPPCCLFAVAISCHSKVRVASGVVDCR